MYFFDNKDKQTFDCFLFIDFYILSWIIDIQRVLVWMFFSLWATFYSKTVTLMEETNH